MSRFDHLREQIDACRFGSRDLELPALAELSPAIESDAQVAAEFGRVQAWDSALQAALADVPVPPGLADRLLAAAAEVEAIDTLGLAADAARTVQRAERSWPRLSRRQLVAGASLAVGVVLGFAIYQGLQPAKVVSAQQLSGAVDTWLGQLQPRAWKPLAAGKYPLGVSADTAVRVDPKRWQALHFDDPAGWSADVTALDLAAPGRLKAPQAVLFVVRSSARFVVPPNPTSTKGLGLSRGMKAVAWQRMNSPWLYVLAVEEAQGQTPNDYLRATHYTAHEPESSDQPL